MENLDDLLNAVKQVTGNDNQTSRQLGVPNQQVANWRGKRSMPSNKHIIEMCKLADLDLGNAILAVEYSRENERPLKEAGFATLPMLALVGGTSLGAMSLANVTSLPYEGVLTALATGVMYIMLNNFP